MKHFTSLALLLMTIFLFQNCSNSKKTVTNSSTAQLNGIWELNYISGPRIAFEGLYPNKKPQLIFNLPATEVSGNSSCNGFSAPVKIDGSRISFGDGRQTMMACPGNGEQVFMSTLKKITSYSVDGSTLTLIMGDVTMMRFTKK